MGMEKYEVYVRRSRSCLTYDPGWSKDNLTGGWRSMRPLLDQERCTKCLLCWLYCPDESIDRETLEIDYTYCKGCGLCAAECPIDAIEMVRETG